MKLFRKKENKNTKQKQQISNEQEITHKTGFYTDKGRKDNQEDSYLITSEFENRQLVLVADGLGGLEYGEFASSQTIDVFRNFFIQSNNFDSAESFLTKTALVAASMLMNKSYENPSYKDCATTLTGFMVIGNEYYTVNVGDSRVYLLSDNKLSRKTKDHSFVQHLIDMGELTVEESYTHPKKNLVTSIISSNISNLKTKVEGPFQLKKNDILIACSDGVHDYLTDNKIEKIMIENKNSDNITEILVKAAYDAGSKDNITACFYKY